MAIHVGGAWVQRGVFGAQDMNMNATKTSGEEIMKIQDEVTGCIQGDGRSCKDTASGSWLLLSSDF